MELTWKPSMAPSVTSEEKREQHLLQQARRGDRDAFDSLVLRYRKWVYAIAYRMVNNHEEADDITQDVFIKAYQNLPHFRGECSLKTYFAKIATNTSLNCLKSHRLSRDSGEEPTDRESPDTFHPEAQLIQKSERQQLQTAIANLPEQQRKIIVLKNFADLSCQEIASLTNLSVGTVKSHLFHGLRNLQKMLCQQEPHA